MPNERRSGDDPEVRGMVPRSSGRAILPDRLSPSFLRVKGFVRGDHLPRQAAPSLQGRPLVQCSTSEARGSAWFPTQEAEGRVMEQFCVLWIETSGRFAFMS